MQRFARRDLAVALGIAGIASLLAGGGTILWYWQRGLPYDATSGVWMGLAHDWSRGILYRPLIGPDGFGGTRYMPLFFVILGSLVSAGADIVTAGIALTLLSLSLLLASVFFTMRRLGVALHIALSCTALLLSSITIQLLGIAVKGDLLAAALNVWGFYFALGALSSSALDRRRTGVSITLAVLCWTLAFATKLTALSGAFAFIIWLFRAGDWRRGTRVAASIVSCCAIVAVAANAWSHGRMMTAFAAVASGGANGRYAVLAPLWMLRAIVADPFLAIILTVATISLLRRQPHDSLMFHATTLWLGATAAVTLFIFASPGTDSNHLIDLLAVSLIVVADRLHTRPPRFAVPVVGAFAMVVALTIVPGVPSVAHFFAHSGRPTRESVAELSTALGDRAHRPVLAENPLVPILLGQSPEVLDPFSLRLLAGRDSAVAAEFRRRMECGYYASVILVDWSGSDPVAMHSAIDAHSSPGVSHFYGEMNFPAHFLEGLWRNYALSSTPHPFVVLTHL